MRLLIYGMQSSGASTLAYLLGQKPDCCAFVDIWTMYAAPSLDRDVDVVAKVVVTTAFPLSLHKERFQPDRTILFLRNHVTNYGSLTTKNYRHHCGFMEEKFAILDDAFSDKSQYDVLLHYEDMALHPEYALSVASGLGWNTSPSYQEFPRSRDEIRKRNQEVLGHLGDRVGYGFGNIHGQELNMTLPEVVPVPQDCPVLEWCPNVMALYEERAVAFAERGDDYLDTSTVEISETEPALPLLSNRRP